MQVHLRITTESVVGGTCTECGIQYVQENTVMVYASGGGLEIAAGPWCMQCLQHKRLVEVVVLEGGAKPPSRAVKKKSRKQEQEIAEDIGGTAQKGSGNQPGYKGDVRKRGKYRIEAKLTEAKSYTIKREILDKIRSECAGLEKPAVVIDFVDRNQTTEDRWVVIPYDDFLERVHAADHRRPIAGSDAIRAAAKS